MSGALYWRVVSAYQRQAVGPAEDEGTTKQYTTYDELRAQNRAHSRVGPASQAPQQSPAVNDGLGGLYTVNAALRDFTVGRHGCVLHLLIVAVSIIIE